jgi:hypothetical protein
LERLYALPESAAEFFYPKKRALLGRGMDISLGEIRAFSKLGDQVEKSHLSSGHAAGEADKVKMRDKWLKWDEIGTRPSAMQAAMRKYIDQLFAQ